MKNIFEDKRVVTKILKIGENNQFGNALTKPLPAGSIKRAKNLPTTRKFDLILQGILGNDIILLLLTLNLIKKMPVKNSYFLTKFIHQFLKKKVLSANERPAFQLFDAGSLCDKGVINSYKNTAKTHATTDKKIAIQFYAEHFHLLISRCGWRVTKIRAHYTLEQSKYKKEFIAMNEVSRENSQNDVEKDFYKLMNNANFGYDCCNNADNC